MTVNMFVTPLNSSCSVVLEYNWLTCYNPLIDWVLGSIKLHAYLLESLTLSPTSSAKKAQLPLQNPTTSETPPIPAPLNPPSMPPHIAFIGAATFALASKQPGVWSFTIHLSYPLFSAKSASVSDEAPDLSNVPEEYHEFANVFSKKKADTSALHRPYDLRINLEEGASLPINSMYSLSQSKLTTLQEFINKHLQIGFIHPTNSPHRAPVLFIQKKDRSLQLWFNFRGLNKISKKDQYPLPFISNLLTSTGKAHNYTALDLYYAYHLVHIAEGDEWKTAFHTHYGSFEWMVMPFGLTNIPEIHEQYILWPPWHNCHHLAMIYFDNPSKNKEHVCKVLRRLWRHRFYCYPDNVSFLLIS